MIESPCRNWLHASVLSPCAEAFFGYLQQHGYRPYTVRAYIDCVGHFGRWLTVRRTALGRVDESLVHRFVAQHLPQCKCPGAPRRTLREVRAAHVHLLRVLRAENHIAGPISLVPLPIRGELERFDTHLDEVCGLAPATRISRRLWVGKFLLDRFAHTPIAVDELKPRDIVRFMAKPDNQYKPGTSRLIGCSLRSYLRFRALRYGDQIESLMAAVLSTAQWRLSTPPTYLTPEELTRFLNAFDLNSAHGQRGYAMAHCLVDLGLRASEVAAIKLEDLDWQEGTLKIGGGKSRRGDLLPLPVPTGQAIAQYLRRSRPRTSSRALFVPHRAPFDIAVGASLVRCSVRMAFARCGLADRFTGTHVLRHSAATRMLWAGATLKEIADLLRHRSLDTTTIYTTVDLPRLVAVAAPWPERVS